ncbi:MAG: hypothetical protein B6U88_01010 [Candidatus Aenigmarchaeota archaeon ex4484_56]|nr:MAG: hypothetical protein B6U88_01010 [Candidatus Aenigmarchaeota archaeon ex4484_56]
MKEFPVVYPTKEEKKWVDDYVKKISEIYFGPEKPKIEPDYDAKLPYGVGGVTISKCSPEGCYPYEIKINKDLYEMDTFRRLTPVIHEKTHEAHITNLPYLQLVLPEWFIEGLTVYTNVEPLIKSDNFKYAAAYLDSISSEYRNWYGQVREFAKKVSLPEFLREANRIGEKYSEYFVREVNN